MRESSIWWIKRTGEIFQSRKEIKQYLGAARFVTLLKKGEVLYITQNQLDRFNNFMMLKNCTVSVQ